MVDLREKVAYLEGLTKGLVLEDTSTENKLLLKMLDVMGDMADTLDTLRDDQQELEEYVESIDEDLANLEKNFYDDPDADVECVEMECPGCHEMVTFDADLLNEDEVVEVTCPNCGGVVYENTLTAETETSEQASVHIHPGI